MTQRLRTAAVAVWLAAGVAACDKVPLLAPTNSTINLSSATQILPLNGSAGLTAFVTESSGTPVQNGTTVRFTTTLGTVQPAETQTHNGIALATFVAGSSSGVAEVRAISGGSTATAAAAAAAANVVKITIGAAAVKTVTLRANPGTVPSGGGSVELIATVLTTDGNGLPGVPVTFSTDKGVLTAQTVSTDAGGEARSVLTTADEAKITATAGAGSATLTITLRPVPVVTITCALCATPVQATSSANTATVVFVVTKSTGAGFSNLRDATIDFGDGITQGLGTLAGAATLSHAYNGPSGSSPRTYTATVRATDVNGETATASTNLTVTPRAVLSVELAAVQSAAVHNIGELVTFTATVAGGDAQSYAWDFGDGATATTTTNKATHIYTSDHIVTAVVTVTTTDGRTATGRAEFIVTGVS